MSQLFLSRGLVQDSEVIRFDKEESRHIVRVLRKKKGDPIEITNGAGLRFRAELSREDSKGCEAAVREILSVPPPPYRLHLAVAPLKSNERFEWMLEKATEIGVTEISPIWCAHSERRTAREERWERILEAALKQSQRDHLPRLHAAVEFRSWLERQSGSPALLAHCREGERMPEAVWTRKIEDSCTLAIGPEGDFSQEEIKESTAKGFLAVSLGPNRLRTETAAIYALSLAVAGLRR